MIVRRITQKSVWEEFVAGRPDQNFLHSWNWGQMHRQMGREVYPIGWYDGQLQAVALFIQESAKRGPHLTCAGGPLLDWQSNKQVAAFVTFARQLGQACGGWFIRVRPQLKDTPAHRQLFRRQGFVAAPMHVTAETTWQLDLAASQDELLGNMRKNHRYDIRKAERKGVKVTVSKNPDDIDTFYTLQLETAQRKHWVPFPKQFLKEEFRTFVKDDQALLFKAFYQKQLVAMALFILYGQEAVYHHAVSRLQARNVSAAYALIWQAIQVAQKRKLKRLNFWGLAPEGKEHHRYSGMNLFKQGFGGYPVNFLPAQDLPVSPAYWLTAGFELIRKARRGL